MTKALHTLAMCIAFALAALGVILFPVGSEPGAARLAQAPDVTVTLLGAALDDPLGRGAILRK